MGRAPQFKIRKIQKDGRTYYRLFVPAHLNADKKERALLFTIKADAERKRGELIAAYRGQERESILGSAQERDAMQAIKLLAEADLSCTLTEAVRLALPLLKTSGSNASVAAEQRGKHSFVEINASTLQEWLNLSGTTRSELAEQLHVNKRTVDSWLGRVHRPIPARLRTTIEKLISPAIAPDCLSVNVTFTEAEWEALTSHIPDDFDKKKVFKQQVLAMINALKLPKTDA